MAQAQENSPQVIAVAVVVDGLGRVLVGRRPAGKPLAHLAEFPGGKVLPGETPAQAARRECLEETGLHVRVERRLEVVSHHYEHAWVEIHFFLAQVEQHPPPVPREPFVWIPWPQALKLDFPPANSGVLKQLAGLLGERFGPEKPTA